MYIRDKEYYHIHKLNEYTNKWIKGNNINLSHVQSNHFMKFYDNFAPFLDINGDKKPIMKGLEEIGASNTYILNSKHIEDIYHALNDLSLFMRETIFEEIRAKEFKDLPSRKKCIWVCEERDLDYWKEQLNYESITHKIFKLKLSGKIHIADPNFLSYECFPGLIIKENARNYWRGINYADNGIKEILFEGEVVILDEINI